MEQCAFCQATLDAETRFCWQCGRARTSMLLVEATSPSQALPSPARRCAVCGAVMPKDASVCGNCFSRQPGPEDTIPKPEPAAPEPLKRCATCGEESPLWARFCGACRSPFALPAASQGELTVAGAALGDSGVAGTLTSPPVSGVLETSPWRPIIAFSPPGVAAKSGLLPRAGQMRLKIIAALVATALVATTAGVTLAYFLTRPQPVMQVTGSSLVGRIQASSPGVPMQLSGQNFSHNSSVTILLDDKPAPGVQSVPTDGFGSFRVDLNVTEAWRYGLHTLTATDVRGYATRSGVQVKIIPGPVITVQSQYRRDNVPAGAASTTLHISGKWFSYQSPITFLVDGKPAPDSVSAQSDAQGQVTADLTVTDDWALGDHTLTAEDGQGYVTRRGQPLTIVSQGQASTPGPNGAPADDASFALVVTVQIANPLPGQPGTMAETLIVTGQADPAGGTVCQARDDSQPFILQGVLLDASGQPTAITYQETLIATCTGSYHGGRLNYTETATSDQYILSNGLTCQASVPYTLQVVNGAFDGPGASSGDWNSPSNTILCPTGLTFIQHPDQQGMWSATQQ